MTRSGTVRGVLLGLVALPLVAVGGGPSAGGPVSLRLGEVRPAVPPPDTDQAAIAALRNPALTATQKARAIERLGRFDRSPWAVAELVRWIDFEPLEPGVVYPASIVGDHPAVRALMRVGPYAVPQLIDDHIAWFDAEPTPEKARHQLQPMLIFSSSREMAAAVVADACRRLRDNPDDRTRRACRELIEWLPKRYWKGEWPELFPDLIPKA